MKDFGMCVFSNATQRLNCTEATGRFSSQQAFSQTMCYKTSIPVRDMDDLLNYYWTMTQNIQIKTKSYFL